MSTTYNALSTALQSYIIEVSPDFITTIPVFINTSETRILRDLDTHKLTKLYNTTMTAGSATLSRPSDLVSVKSIAYYPTSTTRTSLLERTFPYIRDYWPNPNDTSSLPKFYTWIDSYFYIAPTPITNYSTDIVYIYTPTPLSVSNQTNIISTDFSDLLLYASLVEAYLYVQDDAGIARAEKLYQDRILKANAMGRKETQDDMQTYNMQLPESTTTNNSRRA